MTKINIGVVINYPLSRQMKIGHFDVLQVMFENLLNIFQEVHVISLADSEIYELGRRIHSHPIPAAESRQMVIPSEICKISKLIIKHNISVIRALATVRSGFVSAIACKLTRRPLILSVHSNRQLVMRYHGIKQDALHKKIYNYGERFALSSASIIPVISRYIADWVLQFGVSGKKIVLHPNFVDIEKFKPSAHLNDVKRIVFVGRLVPIKGAELAIKAIHDVLKNQEVELFIIGDGPQRKYLEKLAFKLDISKFVKFLGYTDHSEKLPQILKDCDVFIAPLTAGFSLIEAMACGLPVVAANIDWAEDVVNRNVGILTKSGSISELANAVSLLIDNRKKLKSMGRAAREKAVNDFSLKAWKARELEIYKSII